MKTHFERTQYTGYDKQGQQRFSERLQWFVKMLSTWNICVTLHFKILLTDICRSKLITAYCGVSKCQVTSLLASKYLFMQGNIFLYISVACSYCIFLLRFAFSLLCLRRSSHGPPKALSFRPVRLYVRACVPSENILRPSCCRLFVVTIYFFIFLACFSFVFLVFGLQRAIFSNPRFYIDQMQRSMLLFSNKI